MADTREWFKMDVGYLSNPKVGLLLDEHPRAVLLHVACIAYSRQHRTRGIVPMRLALRIACAQQCDLDAACNAGLLKSHDASHLLVHDYLDHQEDPDRIAKRSEDGRKAAAARWDRLKANADANADANATGNATGNAEKRREEKRENTPSSADADAEFEAWWKHYPRKVDKGHAKKAYKAARATTDADTLTAAVISFAEHTRGSDAQFIAHATTWLRGQRWLDQPDPVTTIPKQTTVWCPEDYV